VVVRNHEDKDASFFIKLSRAKSTHIPFRNRNYVKDILKEISEMHSP
jgi:hypothetical protein